MANPYELFKTNEKAEKEEGVILNYGDFGFQIARAGGSNKKFGELIDKRLLKPFRLQLKKESMDEEVALGIMRKIYVDSVIISPLVKAPETGDCFLVDRDGNRWNKGLLAADGSILEGTKEEMIKQFTDLPELFKDIQEQAGKISLFRAAEIEEDAKN